MSTTKQSKKSTPRSTPDVMTAWNLNLFYTSPEDPKLEKDIQAIEKAYAAFATTYASTTEYLTNEDALLQALTDWEELINTIGAGKPLFYLYNLLNLESQNSLAQAKVGLYEPRLTKAGNQTLFFELSLGKIVKENQDKFLKSHRLAHFRYYLQRIFENSKYMLSEAEEKVMSLKQRPAHSMWVDSFSKTLSSLTITFKRKTMSLAEAINMISQFPTKDRRALHTLCMTELKKISDFAEAEINAIYSNKQINDELRKLPEPYSATIIGYENDEKAVLSLIDTVTKGFSISKKFYKLKAKLLKLDSLKYPDRAVGIGKTEKAIPFEQAIEIIRGGFEQAHPRFKIIFDSMLKHGQIDVYSKKGKTGGAYCWGGAGVDTLVLLNYVPGSDGVMTLAHEMGHAIHTELSKKPTPLYQHYTTSVAEVASTFFENLAFEEVFKTLSDKEKIVALHDRIQDAVQTIFRQIACFNFELELHRTLRSKGSLTKEEIGSLHNKHMAAYMGPIMKFTELDGYFFENWSHIRNFFYVYSYAYGAIISSALYKMYKDNPKNIEKVIAFMEAGASMSPEDIFKHAGLDTTKAEFFEQGLKSIEEDIKTLEKLAKKNKLI